MKKWRRCSRLFSCPRHSENRRPYRFAERPQFAVPPLSGLSLRKGAIFLRSVRLFSVYSARIDPKHIIGVQYLQNPLQRFSGRCTLVLQTSGGWPAQYKLYHVPLKEARRWVQNSLGVSSGD